MPPAARILVVKHGALGDWAMATGPFAAIRAHHPGARVVLLTAPAFAEAGRRCGWFDEVWTDDRPARWRLPAWRALRRRLAGAGFDRVYDLQTSRRTARYYRLFPRRARPEWSGVAAGCSHPHANPRRDSMHTIDRQAEQLAMAGIAATPPPDLSWLDGDVSGFGLPARFALLVPGGAAHRPEKRWPAARYAALARTLARGGTTPAAVGGAAERGTLAEIAAAAPELRDLCGRTTLGQLAALARRARCAVGNDTGPTHVAAICGCPTAALFGAASDPARCAPRGPAVRVLRRAPLAALAEADVEAALADLAATGRGASLRYRPSAPASSARASHRRPDSSNCPVSTPRTR